MDRMKTSARRVPTLLLAVAMAMPLWTATGVASAHDGTNDGANDSGNNSGTGRTSDIANDSDTDERHPPMMHGGPEQGGPANGPRRHRGMPPFGAPEMDGMGWMGKGRAPLLRGVELTEAQEDKVFAILHAETPYLREQGKAAAKAHEALRAMAGAGKYDDAKAASLAKAAGAAMANIALQRVRTEQKLLAVLTPEQRKQQAESSPN
jgi:Spy/CpxP family protein refolding chaperone